ncbi:unnamed protein product [Pieris macdunnoughi]|uniref:Uncharacterized protein n=1 Tax=Pieris macdunnoughi TaxID=345717 RepID=A0A821NLT9_9NEOP|nr:unnamed protein product [Pieris macdunnoughi]
MAYVAKPLSIKHTAAKIQRTLDLLPEWLDKWRHHEPDQDSGDHLRPRPPDRLRYPRELFSAGTDNTRAGTAAVTAGRLVGPPPLG